MLQFILRGQNTVTLIGDINKRDVLGGRTNKIILYDLALLITFKKYDKNDHHRVEELGIQM